MGKNKMKERHPIRTLFKLAVFAAIVGAIASFINGKRLEYTGLTESEARAKFRAKVGSKIGEDKADEIADEVIPVLKERGLIVEDPIAEAVDEAVEDIESNDG